MALSLVHGCCGALFAKPNQDVQVTSSGLTAPSRAIYKLRPTSSSVFPGLCHEYSLFSETRLPMRVASSQQHLASTVTGFLFGDGCLGFHNCWRLFLALRVLKFSICCFAVSNRIRKQSITLCERTWQTQRAKTCSRHPFGHLKLFQLQLQSQGCPSSCHLQVLPPNLLR
mmetsp:Transcript_27454/g.66433  ORF Transcript_27454/g.66433 Transcript_27454/m.66433 type:complete len:170 (-) Transcript_27454:1811-2320(-)